jgi:putative transposase
MDEMLECMQGTSIFLKFDLKMGYNQLLVKPEDRWKTAFMTPKGPWYLNIMTFGFANVPSYFQHFMSDKVLARITQNHMENYLNDTGTHNENLPDHIETNRQVLQCFQNNGLFTNAKKCEFHTEHLEFLGVDMSAKGFEMEAQKVDSVHTWKEPHNIRGV